MNSRPIRLVVGLGNPGSQYERTRHNAGFWLIDEIAANHHVVFRAERGQADVASVELAGYTVHLLKPQLYMNRSGLPVHSFSRYRNIAPEEILVAHDELDFEPGVVRLKVGGGHGGHNGLRDLVAHLGGAGFARVRIGIGRSPSREETAHYVLSRPSPGDQEAIREGIRRVAELIPAIVRGELATVMNELNTRPARRES